MPAEASIVHVIDDDEAARDSLAFMLGTAKINVKTYDSVAFWQSRRMSNPAASSRM
jgi:FixJ family two-component response regulator